MHTIKEIYIKLIGNHPKLPLTIDNVNRIKEQSIENKIHCTIGSTLTGLPESVHQTICFIPYNQIEEYSVPIIENIDYFSMIFDINFNKVCLSKFGSKLVVVYSIEENAIMNNILEKCYPGYNKNKHHFHVSIPVEFNYTERKYIPKSWVKEKDAKFWMNYIEGMRFTNVRYL